MSARFRFVIPDPRASISGGNVYNLALIGALEAQGVAVDVIDREGAWDDPRREDVSVFVDSLYLDALPKIARAHAHTKTRCLLLAHYLPAFVEGRADLSELERDALVSASGFVAPSAFMASELARVAPAPRASTVIAPGIDVDLPKPPPAGSSLSGKALIVANLVPAKGVLELLRALGPRRIPLAVIGSTDVDPAYAAACLAAAPDVAFLGARSHSETLAQIATSELLISSSKMESFGLALAEARALGVPIVARDGGNAAAHVDPEAGGQLCADEQALADACVRLFEEPRALRERRSAAMARRPPRRTWAEAARELLAAFERTP